MKYGLAEIMKKLELFQHNYTKSTLYVSLIPLILAGKAVRYTVMKTVLVDTSIGHSMLRWINRGSTPFRLLSDDGNSVATGNAAWLFHFFKYLGIDSYTGYEMVITILWNLLLLLLLQKVWDVLTTEQTLFAMLSIAVLNIFDFNLAKEPMQMLYFVALYYVILSVGLSIRAKYLASSMVLLLSVLTFRSYYILVLFFATETAFVFWIMAKENREWNYKYILATAVLLFFSYYILLHVCQIVSLDTFAELYRVRTRKSTAASDMRVIFHSGNLLVFCVDYLIMLVRMMFPVELLRLGVKYAPYTLYQIVMSVSVIRAVRNVKENTEEQNLALYLYLGFLMASGTFEPDFGSWVRHEAVCFPLFLIINGSATVNYGEEDWDDEYGWKEEYEDFDL